MNKKILELKNVSKTTHRIFKYFILNPHKNKLANHIKNAHVMIFEILLFTAYE